MRIVTNGAKELLVNRIQCMRDTNNLLQDRLEDLEQRRAECCGYSLSSSESSSSSSGEVSSSSSGDLLEFAVITENSLYQLDENNNYEVTEAG